MRGGAITSASSVDPVNRIISRHRDPTDFRAAIYGGGIRARQEFLRGRFEEFSSDLLNHRCVIYLLDRMM